MPSVHQCDLDVFDTFGKSLPAFECPQVGQSGAETECQEKAPSAGVGPFGAPLQQMPAQDSPLGEASAGSGSGWRKSSWRGS